MKVPAAHHAVLTLVHSLRGVAVAARDERGREAVQPETRGFVDGLPQLLTQKGDSTALRALGWLRSLRALRWLGSLRTLRTAGGGYAAVSERGTLHLSQELGHAV
jgi:hypothetical protein